MTPLIQAGEGCWWKLDHLNPTLSFKDRGAVVLMAALAGAGVRRVATDSSGNAGTAIAAYAARAGIRADVFVPGGTSPAKLAGLVAHGARVEVVEGDREAAAAAARAYVEHSGVFYASHVYQPLFVEGIKTVALEIWEQLGRSPDYVVVPAGNGTLVLGAARGFATLKALGLLDVVPRIVAVQAARCAPLAGRAPCGVTQAEGIAVAFPARAEEIHSALESCGGKVVTVEEAAIGAAGADLARRGVWVEPTAATAWAACREGLAGAGVGVVVLCGAGLKAVKAVKAVEPAEPAEPRPGRDSGRGTAQGEG